jgi:hypothetical protein
MRAVLVFINGTICDRTAQLPLWGAPEFYAREAILKDSPASGEIERAARWAAELVQE